MATYIVEKNLTTTNAEKATSWGIALVISSALIFLLWFLHITVPNPPFEVKQGVVELDFGMVDGGFGQPDQGGPSPTPPAQGGEVSDGGAPNAASGGYGDIVNNDADNSNVNLPPIEPPQSSQPSGDPRLGRLGKVGSRTGSGQPGDPNGFPGGSGRTGSGSGGNNGGVTGIGGRVPGTRGNGLYSYNFANFKLQSDVTKVNADGEGDIVCRVSVDCGGRSSVIEYGSRGTTYSGSLGNMRQVFDYFLSKSTFVKIGEKCPESGYVTLKVRRTI
ncbi:MAG: hypothetical protein KG003_04860 [Bacteroidetes bacterium]|nr:hypothetical protein [Bacteroidota bacterium]